MLVPSRQYTCESASCDNFGRLDGLPIYPAVHCGQLYWPYVTCVRCDSELVVVAECSVEIEDGWWPGTSPKNPIHPDFA